MNRGYFRGNRPAAFPMRPGRPFGPGSYRRIHVSEVTIPVAGPHGVFNHGFPGADSAMYGRFPPPNPRGHFGPPYQPFPGVPFMPRSGDPFSRRGMPFPPRGSFGPNGVPTGPVLSMPPSQQQFVGPPRGRSSGNGRCANSTPTRGSRGGAAPNSSTKECVSQDATPTSNQSDQSRGAYRGRGGSRIMRGGSHFQRNAQRGGFSRGASRPFSDRGNGRSFRSRGPMRGGSSYTRRPFIQNRARGRYSYGGSASNTSAVQQSSNTYHKSEKDHDKNSERNAQPNASGKKGSVDHAIIADPNKPGKQSCDIPGDDFDTSASQPAQSQVITSSASDKNENAPECSETTDSSGGKHRRSASTEKTPAAQSSPAKQRLIDTDDELGPAILGLDEVADGRFDDPRSARTSPVRSSRNKRPERYERPRHSSGRGDRRFRNDRTSKRDSGRTRRDGRRIDGTAHMSDNRPFTSGSKASSRRIVDGSSRDPRNYRKDYSRAHNDFSYATGSRVSKGDVARRIVRKHIMAPRRAPFARIGARVTQAKYSHYSDKGDLRANVRPSTVHASTLENKKTKTVGSRSGGEDRNGVGSRPSREFRSNLRDQWRRTSVNADESRKGSVFSRSQTLLGHERHRVSRRDIREERDVKKSLRDKTQEKHDGAPNRVDHHSSTKPISAVQHQSALQIDPIAYMGQNRMVEMACLSGSGGLVTGYVSLPPPATPFTSVTSSSHTVDEMSSRKRSKRDDIATSKRNNASSTKRNHDASIYSSSHRRSHKDKTDPALQIYNTSNQPAPIAGFYQFADPATFQVCPYSAYGSFPAQNAIIPDNRIQCAANQSSVKETSKEQPLSTKPRHHKDDRPVESSRRNHASATIRSDVASHSLDKKDDYYRNSRHVSESIVNPKIHTEQHHRHSTNMQHSETVFPVSKYESPKRNSKSNRELIHSQTQKRRYDVPLAESSHTSNTEYYHAPPKIPTEECVYGEYLTEYGNPNRKSKRRSVSDDVPTDKRRRYGKSSSGYEKSSTEYVKSSSVHDETLIEYDKSSSGYNKPSNVYDETSVGYDKSSNRYEKPSTRYERALGTHDKQPTGYDKSLCDYDQFSIGYDKTSSEYDKQSSTYAKSSSRYDKPSTEYDKSLSTYERTSTGYGESSGGYEKSKGVHDKSSSGYDKCSDGYVKSSKGYEKSSRPYDKSSTGYNDSSCGYEKSKGVHDNSSSVYDKHSSTYVKSSNRYDKPSTGHDKSPSAYDKPSRGYGESSGRYEKYPNRYEKSSHVHNKFSTGYDKPSIGYDKSSHGYEKSSSRNDIPLAEYNKSSGGYDKSYDNNSDMYEKYSIGYNKSSNRYGKSSEYDKLSTGHDNPSSVYDKSLTGSEKISTGYMQTDLSDPLQQSNLMEIDKTRDDVSSHDHSKRSIVGGGSRVKHREDNTHRFNHRHDDLKSSASVNRGTNASRDSRYGKNSHNYTREYQPNNRNRNNENREHGWERSSSSRKYQQHSRQGDRDFTKQSNLSSNDNCSQQICTLDELDTFDDISSTIDNKSVDQLTAHCSRNRSSRYATVMTTYGIDNVTEIAHVSTQPNDEFSPIRTLDQFESNANEDSLARSTDYAAESQLEHRD